MEPRCDNCGNVLPKHLTPVWGVRDSTLFCSVKCHARYYDRKYREHRQRLRTAATPAPAPAAEGQDPKPS